MDWIERLFGVSPDGGNGMLEAVYVGIVVLGVAAVVLRHRIRRWARVRRRRAP
jgi:hypothetical protein